MQIEFSEMKTHPASGWKFIEVTIDGKSYGDAMWFGEDIWAGCDPNSTEDERDEGHADMTDLGSDLDEAKNLYIQMVQGPWRPC